MKNLNLLRILLPAVWLFTVVAVSAEAQEPTIVAQEPSVGPQDRAELEAFIDGLMTAHLEAYGSAGATISVVKDGALFFSKGYGYADVETKKKVEAEKTLFRIGSVSKLFVWTAVMQLVEQGKIDLDEDVNTYLEGLEIPPYQGEPVTMAHLMTHSAGFEDLVVGLFARDEESLRPLGDILKDEMPHRVRPAGAFSSYSNHGTGIAMYTVQSVSGIPWEQYIEDRILVPLGMDHTTFTQPVPERLAAHMSKGYSFNNDDFEEKEFEFIPLASVGACSSSAVDMAKFMIAHLQFGAFGDTRILLEDTARRMQSELFRHDPEVDPMAYGFIVTDRNDQHIVGHGGDTFWFHTMLALFPEHNVGIFVSHNTDEGGQAASTLVEQFTDRYFPTDEKAEPLPSEDFADRAHRFVGSYRANRYSHTTIGKLVAIAALEVKDSGNGVLLLDNDRLIEVGPLTFRVEDDDRKIVFKEDENGKITHMLVSDVPIIAFEKLSLLEKPISQAIILGVVVFLLVSNVILWPLAAIIRNHYNVIIQPEARMPLGSKFVAWMASALLLLFLGLFAGQMVDPESVVFGATSALYRTMSIPLVASVFALGALIYMWRIWKGRRGRLFGRLYYTLLVVGFVVFYLQLNYWNLLGFRF
jgi:CubicO group peptidase (beta-lactamase class C family)